MATKRATRTEIDWYLISIERLKQIVGQGRNVAQHFFYGLQFVGRKFAGFDDVYGDADKATERELDGHYRPGRDIEPRRQPIIEELMRVDGKRYANDRHW